MTMYKSWVMMKDRTDRPTLHYGLIICSQISDQSYCISIATSKWACDASCVTLRVCGLKEHSTQRGLNCQSEPLCRFVQRNCGSNFCSSAHNEPSWESQPAVRTVKIWRRHNALIVRTVGDSRPLTAVNNVHCHPGLMTGCRRNYFEPTNCLQSVYFSNP